MFGLPADEEYWRLRGLEAAYDPPTLRILDALGVAPGWKCLEIAAGAGSIALAIQSRAGSVTALEIDARYIRHLSSPSFVVIEESVEDATLPSELDLVHARFLLDLVADPAVVLQSLCNCLRPGGWMLIEEFDDVTLQTSLGSARVQDLHAAVVTAKQQAWSCRGLDNYLGRKLPDWLASFGLTDIESECQCRVRQAGTPGTLTWRQSLVGLEQSLTATGLVKADLDEYVTALDVPGFSYLSPLVVRAWGHAPLVTLGKRTSIA